MHSEAHSYDESATLAHNETVIGNERVRLRLLATLRHARLERVHVQADGTLLSTVYFIDDRRALTDFCGTDPYHRYLRDGYAEIREGYERFVGGS